MEQERVAEQKELDAALVRLTRLREEMSRVPAPGPTQLASMRSNVGRAPTVASSRGRDGDGEGRVTQEARKIVVRPFTDMPGASEQSIALFQHPARDRSSLMATLIDRGGTIAGSSNRFNPLG